MDKRQKKIVWVVTKLTSLRYVLRWKGLEHLNEAGTYLLLSNHPAEVDPLILMAGLWPRIHLRPVMLADFAKVPFLGGAAAAMRAIQLPDLERDSILADDARMGIEHIVDALRSGDNVLLYPSGRLMRGGLEQVWGAASAFEVVRRAPEVKLRLVRIRGLFGSISSTAAASGDRPRVCVAAARIVWQLLRHGIFFLPKREVTIEVAMPPAELLNAAAKQDFNRSLEAWFNEGGPEAATSDLISLTRPDGKLAKPARSIDGELDSSLWHAIQHKLSEVSGKPAAEIEPELSLRDELCLDSLQIIELVEWLEESYQIKRRRAGKFKSAFCLYHAAKAGKPAPQGF